MSDNAFTHLTTPFMNLSFEVLQALDAIDRTGTFAAAAEELHKVPSSLTYLIQKLEVDLGVKLFERTAAARSSRMRAASSSKKAGVCSKPRANSNRKRSGSSMAGNRNCASPSTKSFRSI